MLMITDRLAPFVKPVIGVQGRSDDGTPRVTAAWSRGGGAGPGRDELATLLRERGVGVPC